MKPGSSIVGAFEQIWDRIQELHPEVPDVVVTIQNRDGNTLGSFQPSQWSVTGENGKRPEIIMATEHLNRTPAQILSTVLHEAAHGACFALGIQDTSRQGRYHNKRFAAKATEMGLIVTPQGDRGLAHTESSDGTMQVYANELLLLADAICAWKDGQTERTEEGEDEPKEPKPKATCGCRELTVSRKFLAEAPLTCGRCGGDFAYPDEES